MRNCKKVVTGSLTDTYLQYVQNVYVDIAQILFEMTKKTTL